MLKRPILPPASSASAGRDGVTAARQTAARRGILILERAPLKVDPAPRPRSAAVSLSHLLQFGEGHKWRLLAASPFRHLEATPTASIRERRGGAAAIVTSCAASTD